MPERRKRGRRESTSRVLYDIAHVLESADGSEERVFRVLDLLRTVVPFEHCALLHVVPEREPQLVVARSGLPAAPTELRDRLVKLFALFAEDPAHELDTEPSPPGRLAVPLVQLDGVTGVLEVSSAADAYAVHHLRVLSVVAAQLAAHLTLLRARTVEADRARELDEARRTAEAANRAKDEFLALVSHELKTPLSSTLAWAHDLGTGGLDAGARAHAVDGIERGVRAQANLIDEILELAGVATAALRLDLRAIEPGRSIKATIERLRLQAEERAIRIDTVLDPSVTALVVDPDRFDQIVSNLVANALAVSPEGGRIEVRLERADDLARIRVTDAGVGIAPELLPQMFEGFQRQRSPSPGTPGQLWVGLAVVKQLVECHGGRVHAECDGEQSGATITVELPLRSEQRPLAGLRVLLVDDDADIREAFQAVLEARGAEVTAADSVAGALAALERSRPDVLLSELALPRQSGYDLVRELVARDPSLPIAALTKYGRPEESRRALAAGFRMHLPKPIEVDALVAAVAHLAGRRVPARSAS